MKLASALAFVVLLVAACADSSGPASRVDGGTGGTGGSEPGTGGTGGSGGVGGSGGEGGSGGTGGSGGEPNDCGNGLLDEGEECDDGNRLDLDGCSSDCRIEGTCERPIPWEAASVMSPGSPHPNLHLREVDSFLRGHETQATACGNEGRQLVYEFISPVDGRFYLNFQNRAGDRSLPRAFATRSCDEPEAAVLCDLEDSGVLSRTPISQGERLFLVVDSGESEEMFRYLLAAGTVAQSEEGEACGRTSPEWIFSFCAPDLHCNEDERCARNRSPVLEEAEFFRHGPDGDHLTLHMVASEEDGHSLAFMARFFDEDGVELTEEPHMLGLFHARDGYDRWVRTIDFFGSWPALVSAVEVEVWVEDIVPAEAPWRTASDPLRVRFDDLPRRGPSQSCDPERVRDLCEPGLHCVGEPGACEDLAPLRAPICNAAEELTLGTELEFVLDQEDLLPPYFELPPSCIEGWKKHQAWYGDGLLTQVFRFSVPTDLEDVHVRLWDPEGRPLVDLGVMLLPGCDAISPLVCTDEVVTTINPTSDLFEEIHLPAVPAGEYLLVVRTTLPSHPSISETIRLLVNSTE